jgi:putative peptidoglycan lipid II flippase
MMLLLNVPATVGLFVLATPIVRLIFEHGRFTSDDTAATASALAFYAPGLVGYSAVKLTSRAFYALGNSRIPMIASAVSVTANVVFSLLVIGVLGHRGLALGTALAALTNAGMLLFFLRDRLAGLEGTRVLTTLIKISAASLLMAFAASTTERLLHIPFPGSSVATQGVRVFGAIGVGVIVLAASAQLLRIEEFTENVRLLKPW